MRNKKLFFAIILLLPVNLGKHFIIRDAYVLGLLVDYLIPTIYLQDVLIFLLLVWWLLGKGGIKKKNVLAFFARREIQILVFFLFSVFLSVISGERFVPSIYAFLRLLLYAGFFVYILNEVDLKKDFSTIVNLFGISVFFLGVLGFLQYVYQGSVFNNYMVLGEQPYSFSTAGIDLENVFGHSKVPAYGLFRHPNIFGGFLSIVLVWIYYKEKRNWFYNLAFLLGFVSLVLTFSFFSFISFWFGIVAVYLVRKGKTAGVAISIALLALAALFFPLLRSVRILEEKPSVYRRAAFLVSGYQIIKKDFLFGVGYNNATVLIEQFLPRTRDLRFVQPVHNIFILAFAESGLFALIFFVVIICLAIKKCMFLKAPTSQLLLVSLLQIVFLGSFDHYFITIHQTQLLFWTVLGLSFL